jgi:glutathione S-transferase
MTKAESGHDFAAQDFAGHCFAGLMFGANVRPGRGDAMTKKMLLHWSPRSPFVRKVMIAAHEVGVADRIDTVRTVVAAAEPNTELMKENPQSRLPTLRLPDGTVVYDSPVICEYFDTLHSGEKLFPANWPERLVALRRQSLGDGMLDTLLMWRGEATRSHELQSIKHMQAWRLKTNVSVDLLEKEADALASSRFSIGHIALGVALGYIDFRFPELDWRNGHPKLAAWHKTFEARPSVKANTPVDEP